MLDKKLRTTVGRVLVLLSKTVKGLKPAEVDADLVDFWTLKFSQHEATEAEVQALLDLATDRLVFFPSFAEMLGLLRELRETERAKLVGSLMPCVDEHGEPFAAPPSRVLDGKLVEEGLGNGKPAPSAPQLPVTPEMRAEAIGRFKKAEAALTLVDNEAAQAKRVREQVKQLREGKKA